MAADRLLFDTKQAAAGDEGRPARRQCQYSFDWSLIAGRGWSLPWVLSGGLNAGNLVAAVAATHATAVDVSSGVEDSPGRKSPEKIAAFLRLAASL